jgi:hypothetical protein
MSRTITLIAAVGAALAVAAPALGKSQPVEPQWMQALEARTQELNRTYGLGEYSPAFRALKLRSEALNRQHELGVYSSTVTNAIDARERSMSVGRGDQSTGTLDARERAFGAKRNVQLSTGTGPDAFERAVAARGTGTTDRVFVHDDRFRIDPGNPPVTVAATGSGTEIDWPQIGIGFGVGIALALGLIVGLRATRQPPLAH